MKTDEAVKRIAELRKLEHLIRLVPPNLIAPIYITNFLEQVENAYSRCYVEIGKNVVKEMFLD